MRRRSTLTGGLAGLLALAALAGPIQLAQAQQQEQAPVERYRDLLRSAWGPETAEDLEAFLDIREELATIVFDKRYQIGIQQWALREAGTMPAFGPAMFGLVMMRRKTDTLLAEKGLTLPDFQRMTMLVYGRWLRASRDEEPPETSVVRSLQELEVGISRHLAHNPPEKETERSRLESRLASVRHQLTYLRPYLMDAQRKQQILERIDGATREWLEEHRERVESLDFRLFDTAPPPRERPRAEPGAR